MAKCDAIEKWEHTHKQKSTFKILTAFLTNDNSISELEMVEKNSYLSYRLNWEKSIQQWENEKREKRLADGLYDGINKDFKALNMELKDSTLWNQFDLSSHKNSKRKVVKSYIRFKFLLSQHKKVVRAYDLNEFSIEEYLRLVDAGFTYEALRYYIDQFAKWPQLKSYNNIYEGYGEFLFELMESGKYEH